MKALPQRVIEALSEPEPLKIEDVKTVKDNGTTYIYIITNRDVEHREGLDIALPYLLSGIANAYNVHIATLGFSGVVYLISDDEDQEDFGILYADEVMDEGLPGISLEVADVLQRYVFFGIVEDSRKEAYIIPKYFLGGEE